MKVILIIFCLIYLNTSCQNFAVKIEKTDLIKIVKQDVLIEDGLVFYKDEYNLTITNRKNKEYNKQNKFKTIEFAGGQKYCEKCKRENYYFNIKKIKNIPKYSNLKIVKLNELFKNLNPYAFGGNYFIINNEYYKNLGMPIE